MRGVKVAGCGEGNGEWVRGKGRRRKGCNWCKDTDNPSYQLGSSCMYICLSGALSGRGLGFYPLSVDSYMAGATWVTLRLRIGCSVLRLFGVFTPLALCWALSSPLGSILGPEVRCTYAVAIAM